MAFFLRGNDHHSRKYRRHLYRSKINLFFSFFGIFFGKKGSDIQCFIADQRKWSGRIHCHWCQDRIYIVLKILIHKLLLLLGKGLVLKDHVKSCFFKGRDQRPV